MDVEPSTAQQIAEAVSTGSRAFEAITRGLQSLKTIVGLTKKDPQPEVGEILVDLREQISLARDANSKLREITAELRDENTELKRRIEDFAGYELWETPRGSIVYRSADGQQPMHYLCPACKENGLKSFLNGDEVSKKCKADSTHGWFYFRKDDTYEKSRRWARVRH
jgi:hypothetical protein